MDAVDKEKLLKAWIEYFPDRWATMRPAVFPAGDDVIESIYWFDDLASLLKGLKANLDVSHNGKA